MIWGRFIATAIGFSALAGVVGCADQTTTVTSVSFIEGGPNGQSASTQPTGGAPAIVKTWLNTAWVNPSGPSWTPNGDNGNLTVWCNSNGDWSISHYILNHGLFWHSYETTVVFGHLQGNDPNSFVPYASHVTSTIIVHHGHSNTTMADGLADPAIKANFKDINAARASLHEH